MDSGTIERVFGGLTYLGSAPSKAEFFGGLEMFLQEIFGSVTVSLLAPDPRGVRFRVEFSNHPECRQPAGGLLEAESPELFALASRQRGREAGQGCLPPALWIGGRQLPVLDARLIADAAQRWRWIVFHDSLNPSPEAGEVFGLDGFVFDHVSAAYFRVDDIERLREHLCLAEARLAAFNRFGEVMGHLDVDVLLAKLMELSLFIASAQVGSVVLVGEQGVDSKVEWGLPLEAARRLRHRGGPSILDRVLSTKEPELIENFRDSVRFEEVPDLCVDSYLCIPLLSKGKLLGAINLVNSAEDSGFSRADEESILTISGLAAAAIENAILHRDSLEKERITTNLRIAQSIQKRMYPKACPALPGYDISWVSLSCEETGGDYFDFVPLDDDSIAAVIGDVSGHGIGAALLMAAGRANLRALFSVKRGIREVMLALDALLAADMDDERFMTLFVGKIDHRRHLLSYLNAGHDHPLFYRKKDGRVTPLPSTGLPLGILGAGADHREEPAVPMEPGDALLLFTDGLWEEVNATGERFGKERLVETLVEVAAAPAARIIDAIQERVFAFTQGVERKDDLTLVCIKRVEPSAASGSSPRSMEEAKNIATTPRPHSPF